MRLLAPVAAILLAGCNGLLGPTDAEKAEAEYELIEKTPLAQDQRCAAAIKVRDAYRAAGDADAYEMWTLFAQTDCARP